MRKVTDFKVAEVTDRTGRDNMKVNKEICKVITWIRWYVSDIIAMSRFIKTITETNI